MKIGFTGTRNGMTEAQKAKIADIVRRLRPTEAHHGDCVGADAEFHDIVRLEAPHCKIVGHPGPDGPLRAHCKVDEERPAKPYKVRNRNIVNETDALASTPAEMQMQAYGGTWSTIRYGQDCEGPVAIVFPSGRDTYNVSWCDIEPIPLWSSSTG